MNGKQVKFEKIFNQNENAVVVAIDHCGFVGPIPGLVDIHETIQNIAGTSPEDYRLSVDEAISRGLSVD